MSTSFAIDNTNTAAPATPTEPGNAMQRGYKRLIGNKFLLAVVIVCMSAIFVGGVCTNDGPKSKAVQEQSNGEQDKPAQSEPATQAGQSQPAATFTPQLAIDFVKWLAPIAMDYSTATAKAHHIEAFRWMTPDCQNTFQSAFWTPALDAEIAQGRITSAFQPVSVIADAINPDGTVVVTLTGTLVMQAAGQQPITTQLVVDFLVRHEPQGLRICGLYNHPTQPALAQAPSYAQPQPSVAPAAMDAMAQPFAAPMAQPMAQPMTRRGDF